MCNLARDRAEDNHPDTGCRAYFFESTSPVQLTNALSDLFMDDSRNVCITDFEFPEVEGKELRCRPFTLTCESDSVTNLIQE